MELRTVTHLDSAARAQWRGLLEEAGLQPEEPLEQTVLLYDGATLCATGSRQGGLLKCIAVSNRYRGQDLTAQVVTALRREAFAQGHRQLFLFTKPQNEYLFQELLFYPVAQTREVLLMEDRKNGIGEFLKKFPPQPVDGPVGALVMNCNPFTLGHQHLVREAARSCSRVYLFVLSQEQPPFTTRERMDMVLAGTGDLPNVTVLPTGPYMISQATFPTYFLPDREQAPRVQCDLDIAIFLRHMVPHFGITCRFVGTEPFSLTTARYNEALSRALPPAGVALFQLPRLQVAGTPVTATAARSLLARGNWEGLKKLVPETTYDYLRRR